MKSLFRSFLFAITTAAFCASLHAETAQTPAAHAPAGSADSSRAYTIERPEQLTTGKLADAYLGDFVLENKLIRAVIARPDKPAMGNVRGGSLIDLVRKTEPVDYFAALNTTVDPLSTASEVLYDTARLQEGSAQTSAAIMLTGHIGAQSGSAPASERLIAVQTQYSLDESAPLLRIDSRFTNKTTQTAWIRPADVIDWGEATVFTDAAGFRETTSPVRFAIGGVDNFSAGYFTSGTKTMEGDHAGRESIVLSGGGIDELARITAARRKAHGHDDSDLPMQYRGMGASNTPKPGYVLLPGTETRYGMSGFSPVPMPLYVPSELVQVVDGKTTVTSFASLGQDPFVGPASTTSSQRIKLDPGHSFEFSRFIQVSDANWAPIAASAYAEKDTATVDVAGVILEQGTEKPVPGAKVQVSGGPSWNGSGNPPPVLQLLTDAAGNFAAKLPPGKYRFHPVATGRYPQYPIVVADIRAGEKAPLVIAHLTSISRLRLAISEAETPTSSPLPVKLTIISKPPYPTVDYGFSPDITEGVRNTVYLPQGVAVVPLTPGRYRLVVSRGPEYDTWTNDVTIAPAQQLTLSAPLPHLMKDLLPGMISLDAGLITTASATGYSSPETAVIQAACEGVQVIVSGDYGTATDLQPVIDKLGLTKWVKALTGRRELLHKDNMSADLLVYPIDAATNSKFEAAIKAEKDLPPDIILADLRKQFPGLVFQISRPVHPEAGYLNSFPFNAHTKRFESDNIPPPDFDAIEIIDGNGIGNEQLSYPRYMAMQLARLGENVIGKGVPLSPVGASMSRLPFGQPTGYPRGYLYLKEKKSLAQVTADDVRTAIKGQHFLYTNGPILLFDAYDREKREFSIIPGEICDSHTTEIVGIRARVLAAPWVSLQGINTRENGLRGITVYNILPNGRVERYPTNATGANIYTRYLSSDAVLDAYCYSTLKSLAPVVPDDLTDFGGPVFPYSWSGPIFVDRNGDGKIIIKEDTP